MAEMQRQRIKSIYGEIKGLMQGLPEGAGEGVPNSVGFQYNSAVDELISVSDTNYARLKVTDADIWIHGSNSAYDPIAVRVKVSSLVHRLEEEHGFGGAERSSATSPVIVTVSQNQQLTVSVTPIQEIIDSSHDDELSEALNELKTILNTSKDPEKTSNILGSIGSKSWEVFIKVLPYVLEHMGSTSNH